MSRPILRRVLGTLYGGVVLAREAGGVCFIAPSYFAEQPRRALLRTAEGDRSALRAEFPLRDPQEGGGVVPVNWLAGAIAVLAVARYLGEIHPIAAQTIGAKSSRCPCGRFLRFARHVDDEQT